MVMMYGPPSFHVNAIWLGLIALLLQLLPPVETAIVPPSDPMNTNVGDTLNFTWTSNKKILFATWGIGSSDSPDPQYIYVDDTEVAHSNSALDVNLKKRLEYKGNLTEGRAWFVIHNATLNDSNTYVASIREEGSIAKPYHIVVVIEEDPSTIDRSSTTWPPATRNLPLT